MASIRLVAPITTTWPVIKLGGRHSEFIRTVLVHKEQKLASVMALAMMMPGTYRDCPGHP